MTTLATPSALPPRDSTFVPSDWEILSRFWHPVAFSREVADQPFAAKLLDQRLVVYRTPQGVSVANDICLHRGVPLSMGWMEEGELVCKYHGLRYNAAGQCVAIPAHPGTVIPPKLCLKSYPAVERYGLVWTCLNPTAPVPEETAFPEMTEWDDPDYQQILPNSIEVKGAAGRQVEGFLDVAHFAWIHDRSFGDRDNPVVPNYEVQHKGGKIVADYASNISNFPKALQHLGPEGFVWHRIFEVAFPFYPKLTVHFPNDGRLVILNAASPVSARRTRVFVPIARNFDKDKSLDPVYEFNQQVFEEDREIVERQYPEDLPLDLTEEVHIRADKTSIAYRQKLGKLGLGRMYTA